MKFKLSDFTKLRECQGNKNNKIHVVQHKKTMKMYILKEIQIQDINSQLREIKIHKTLTHSYVIKLIDYDITGDSIIMLIEYAEGGDLYNILPLLQNANTSTLIVLFRQILEAMAYLHSKGIVHRDIKPENILLTDNFMPKLADFGTSGNKRVIANTFCGTYEYMAPEIYLRRQHTDKVDVWAMGILLYELFHLKTPFVDDMLDNVKFKVENRILRFSKQCSDAMIDFVYKALKFDPLERPSIHELLQHELFKDCPAPKQEEPMEERESTEYKQLSSGKNKWLFNTKRSDDGTTKVIPKVKKLKINNNSKQYKSSQNLKVLKSPFLNKSKNSMVSMGSPTSVNTSKSRKVKWFSKSSKKLGVLAKYKKDSSKKNKLLKFKELNEKLKAKRKKENSSKKIKSSKEFMFLNSQKEYNCNLIPKYGFSSKKDFNSHLDVLKAKRHNKSMAKLYSVPSIEEIAKRYRKKEKKVKRNKPTGKYNIQTSYTLNFN